MWSVLINLFRCICIVDPKIFMTDTISCYFCTILLQQHAKQHIRISRIILEKYLMLEELPITQAL